MSREQTCIEPDEDDWEPEGEAVPEIGLEQGILNQLGDMRGLMERFARRLDARADTEEGQKALPQLTNAAVKAVRALRQIAVLQLEIAGKRALPAQKGPNQRGPNQRGPGDASVARNKAEPGDPDRWYPEGYPFDNGDYTDYDDYTDSEREQLEAAKFEQKLERVGAAVDEDLVAAGRSELCRLAPVVKFKLIFGIPHPALDRCLAEGEPGDIYAIFEREDIVPPRLGTGPPGVLEEYDAKRKALLPPHLL